MLIRLKKAQNTMEYAILIAIVVGAFSAMQLYLKRGLQARLRGGSDEVYDLMLPSEATGILTSDNLTAGSKEQWQYEPYYSEGAYTMNTNSTEGVEVGTATDTGGTKELKGKAVSRAGKQETLGAP